MSPVLSKHRRRALLCVSGLLISLVFPVLASARPIDVRGRILAPEGQGLEAVEVQAHSVLPRGKLARARWLARSEADLAGDPVVGHRQPELTTRSTEEGGFALTLSRGMWKLRVSSPSHAERCLSLVPLLEDTRLPTLRLEPALQVGLSVTDSEGQPLEGAFLRTAPVPREGGRWGPCTRTTVTDAEGRAELTIGSGEDNSSRLIHVFRPGYLEESRPLRAGADIQLRVAPSIDLELEVLDPSAPEDSAPAEVVVVGGEGRWSLSSSDSGGNLRLRHLPSSTGSLLFLASDGRATARDVSELLENENAVLKLPRIKLLRGQVGEVTADGSVQPIRDALVWDPADPGKWKAVDKNAQYEIENPVLEWDAKSGGRASLAANAPGYFTLKQSFSLPGIPSTEETEPGEVLTFEALNLWLSSARDLIDVRGRIINPDGEAVEGAEIVFVPASPQQWVEEGVAWALAGIESPGPQPERAVTDAEGVFLVKVRPGSHQLVATHEELAAEVLPGVRVPATDTRFDLGAITIERGHRVSGYLVDEDGEPVPGARGTVVYPAKRGGERIYFPDQRRSEVVTDPDGAFSFGRLPGLELGFRFHKSGFVETTFPLKPPVEKAVRFELQRAGWIRGRVVDREGAPVQGASVWLDSVASRQGRYTSSAFGPGSSSRLRTDEQGCFEFVKIRPGSWIVRADAEGYAVGSSDRLVVSSAQRRHSVEVVLSRGARVSGRVITSGGSPVLGARVEIGPWRTLTGAEGRFEFPERLPPGTLKIVAQHEDHGVAARNFTMEPTDSRRQLDDLILEPRRVLTGRVIDPKGHVFPGCTIILRSEDSGRRLLDSCDDDGRFTFRNLRPGRYSLIGREDPYVGEAEVFIADEESTELDLTLYPPGVIRGKVVGLSNDELTKVTIRCIARDRPNGCQVQPELDGSFEAEGVPLGEWSVAAQLTGTERLVTKNVELSPEKDESTVELRFDSLVPIRGRILQNGEPLVAAEVRLLDGQAVLATTESDWEGGFRFEEVGGVDAIEVIPRASGLPVARRLVGIEEGEPLYLDLQVAPLAGLVVGATGAPLAFADLLLVATEELSEERWKPVGVVNLMTDSQGQFFLPDVPVGSYRLELAGLDAERAWVPIEVHQGFESRVQLTSTGCSSLQQGAYHFNRVQLTSGM